MKKSIMMYGLGVIVSLAVTLAVYSISALYTLNNIAIDADTLKNITIIEENNKITYNTESVEDKELIIQEETTDLEKVVIEIDDKIYVANDKELIIKDKKKVMPDTIQVVYDQVKTDFDNLADITYYIENNKLESVYLMVTKENVFFYFIVLSAFIHGSAYLLKDIFLLLAAKVSVKLTHRHSEVPKNAFQAMKLMISMRLDTFLFPLIISLYVVLALSLTSLFPNTIPRILMLSVLFLFYYALVIAVYTAMEHYYVSKLED